MATEYGDTAPGRCCRCHGKLVRASEPSKLAGKFAFVRVRDALGIERVAHVSCAERMRPPVTADTDHYADAIGTAKKPAHE